MNITTETQNAAALKNKNTKRELFRKAVTSTCTKQIRAEYDPFFQEKQQ